MDITNLKNEGISMDYINKLCMFNSKVIRKLHAPIEFQRKFNAFRHNRIKKKLHDYLVNAEYQDKSISNGNSKYIWVFWAQGYDSMPDLVLKCIETVKKNNGNAQVILLTAENFEKYATLPKWIVNKFRNGIINPMYFSDALRFNLLKNYGGLWLDATDFVIDEITDDYFSDLCTVSGLSDDEHFFIAEGRWHTALFGGAKNHPLFQFMDSFFSNYWKENDESVDYFMTDYALEYAYQNNIGNFREYIDLNKGKIDPQFVDLQSHLNDSFNSEQWNNYIKNTKIFKLTYKMKLKKSNDTFYNFLIKHFV